MSIVPDLERYGPDSTAAVGLAEAQAYCARLTATHYENFSVVTWLTPRELRPAFEAVYSFCRWSDDLGDELGDPERSGRLLAWWRGELESMSQGLVRHPVFVALAPVVQTYAIPPAPFHALIDAFEQDQRVTEYATYADLLDYCTRSANPVGHVVLYLARSFDEPRAALSDATCTALQLANFWQDVERDLAIGRIYLPREDRARFSVSDDDLRSRRCTPEFRALLRFEVERARALFQKGRSLVQQVPGPIALDVDLFTRGGLAILERIERSDFDVLTRRPALTKLDKARLIGGAMGGRLFRRPKRSGQIPPGPDAGDRHPAIDTGAAGAEAGSVR
jgi:squalene synthase HpnC